MRSLSRTLACGLVLAVVAVLTACTSDDPDTPALGAAPPPTAGISAVFTQIYDGNFDANNAGAPYDKFDIVYVAFAHIDPVTHELDFETKVGKDVERKRLEQLKANVASLRAAGKLKLVISLGRGPQEMTSDGTPLIEAYIDKVAPSIPKFLEQNGLDGFDIDYETPRFTSKAKFAEVARKIREAIGDDYLFTITPNNVDGLDGPALATYFDYVNAQSYNANRDAVFSTLDLLNLGVPASKVVAGADIENINHYYGDRNRVAWAINEYKTRKLGGVFIWQMLPVSHTFPGGTFGSYASEVWNATRP